MTLSSSMAGCLVVFVCAAALVAGCSKQVKDDDLDSRNRISSAASNDDQESSGREASDDSSPASAIEISANPTILPDDLQSVDLPIELRHRLTDGTTVAYLIRSSTVANNDVGGRFEETEGTRLRLRVADNRGAKPVEMSAVFEQLAMNLKSPGNDFTFDSRSNDVPAGPLGRMLGPILKTITSGPVIFTIDSIGNTDNVEFPSAFRTAIADNEALSQVGVTEKTFEQMIKSALVPLPEEPIQSGTRWTHVEEATAFGAGISHSAEYQLQGTIESPDGATWAVITFHGTTSGLGESGAPIEAVDVTTKGQLYFDLNNGRLALLASESTGTLDTNVDGTAVRQSLRGGTTVRRLDD